jgi:hypothetical protein
VTSFLQGLSERGRVVRQRDRLVSRIARQAFDDAGLLVRPRRDSKFRRRLGTASAAMGPAMPEWSSLPDKQMDMHPLAGQPQVCN